MLGPSRAAIIGLLARHCDLMFDKQQSAALAAKTLSKGIAANQ